MGYDYIHIYPNGFDAKEHLTTYLDFYNEQFSDEYDLNAIHYIDDSAALSTISKDLINAVTYGLVAFFAVSLIVSSLMIAIITYTSVIQHYTQIKKHRPCDDASSYSTYLY